MQISVLKSKIHRATVTESNLDYEGSIVIDKALMDRVGFFEYEKVDIYNITNGNRFTTYVIQGERDSNVISIQGAAAHRAQKGDMIIICSYCDINAKDAENHKPKKIVLG